MGRLSRGPQPGSCLVWALNIFEIAHPRSVYGQLPTPFVCHSQYGCGDPVVSLYPSMAATTLVVLVASGAFGIGLGLMAWALIRKE